MNVRLELHIEDATIPEIEAEAKRVADEYDMDVVEVSRRSDVSQITFYGDDRFQRFASGWASATYLLSPKAG